MKYKAEYIRYNHRKANDYNDIVSSSMLLSASNISDANKQVRGRFNKSYIAKTTHPHEILLYSARNHELKGKYVIKLREGRLA